MWQGFLQIATTAIILLLGVLMFFPVWLTVTLVR